MSKGEIYLYLWRDLKITHRLKWRRMASDHRHDQPNMKGGCGSTMVVGLLSIMNYRYMRISEANVRCGLRTSSQL